MLKELRIKNLALVRELHVVFDSNLIVLTGETGAGKSIILQAIHLLSGKRAASSWIRNGQDQARVEAVFELPENSDLITVVREMGIDTDGELLLSRVLSRKGKNRFYINGGLSTAKVAERVSEYLLSVASQHDHQLLLLPRHHLDFIDLAGDLWQQRREFADIYARWFELKKTYEQLLGQEREKEQRLDFLKFQADEIRGAKIQDGEDAELEAQKNRLKAVDELRRRGGNCYKILSTDASDALALARKELESMALRDESLAKLSAMVAEQSFVIEESVSALRDYVEELPQDSELLESVTARIDLLQKLKRKYGAGLDDVVQHLADVERELAELESMELLIKDTEEKYCKAEATLLTAASDLSLARQHVAEKLAKTVQNELQGLCLEQARFTVFFKEQNTADLEGLSSLGWDRPEFLFSANPGEPLKGLAKIASGGELSRLTLALKCILARKDMVETVIFDEVDAGIGGKAAEAVAVKIKELALHHQVMCISHLPQIASCAQEHLMVKKNVSQGRTETMISALSGEEKIAEIARMLDGDSGSERSIAFATELIERNSMLASV